MSLPVLLLLAAGWTPSCSDVTPLDHAQAEPQYGRPPSGIPVLMYHHVSDPVNGYYGVSTHRFESDLEALEEAGFHLITTRDLRDGLMQVPEGRRPVMLTFDDGWQDNFSYVVTPDGVSVDESCVLGILEDFCDRHPDFGRGAVFFVSWDKVPFGQAAYVEEKMNVLLDLGYEIGNHTWRHSLFTELPRSEWSASVGRAMELFRDRLGLRVSSVTALAYPGGVLPSETGAEELLSSYTFEGRRAVGCGFLVTGSVSSMAELLESDEGPYRIGRLDMSRYSVGRLLGWRNLMSRSAAREDLHDPLPWRMPCPAEVLP